MEIKGDVLKAARIRRGWDVQEACTASGTPVASWYRAEAGRTSETNLLRICAALGVDPLDALEGDDATAAQQAVASYRSSLAFLLAVEVGVRTADQVVAFLRERGIDLERLH